MVSYIYVATQTNATQMRPVVERSTAIEYPGRLTSYSKIAWPHARETGCLVFVGKKKPNTSGG
jgi:hypothetical protein